MPDDQTTQSSTEPEPAWRARWRRLAVLLMLVSLMALAVLMAIPEVASPLTVQVVFGLVVIGFPLGALVAYALRPRR